MDENQFKIMIIKIIAKLTKDVITINLTYELHKNL